MRKHLLPLCVALMLAFGPSAAVGQEFGILDIYRELQVAQPGVVPQDDITTAPGGALSSGRGTVVTGDAARTYLRFREDPGPGMTRETELAFWLDAEGLPLVGISTRQLRAGVPVAGRILFYSRASGRWNPVTDQVWPHLEGPLCGIVPAPEDDGAQEQDEAGDRFGPVVVRLPQSGTDPEAWCVAPGPRAGRGARIRWNPAAAAFTLGAARAGPPPWKTAPSGSREP